MTASLRVAAHNGARAFGGGEKWAALLLKGLEERGHRVHLFCNHEEVASKARSFGVDASVAPLGGHLMLPHVWSFAGRLRRFDADVVLFTTFKKVWLGGMAARRAGVRRVVSRIGLDTDLPGKHWSYRVAFGRWVDAVLVNADGIRRDVVAGLPGVPAERVATVYDGVRLRGAIPPRDEARRGLGLPLGAPLVGTVARLADQKRLDRFLDTVALLPEVHGVLAGSGPAEGALRSHARALGIQDRVHFLGWRDDVAPVLGAVDLFLITSDREGMANAMLEAMAAGVPVVSTPVSGAEEALAADGEGRSPGLVVPPDPVRLAEACAGVLAVGAVALAMGQEGERRARERFAFEPMLDAWEAVLAGAPPADWHQGR